MIKHKYQYHFKYQFWVKNNAVGSVSQVRLAKERVGRLWLEQNTALEMEFWRLRLEDHISIVEVATLTPIPPTDGMAIVYQGVLSAMELPTVETVQESL